LLCLGRAKGETLVIGVGEERIYVTVANVKGNKVILATNASPHVTINRLEVQERIDREGKNA